MRRVLKAPVSDKPLGDVSTLEEKVFVEESKSVYKEFKKIMKQ